jgi:TrmH family RNA methyltransferase
VEGEDLVEAGVTAGLEPVDVLSAGETVDPDLLAGVSTLAHPPRVIAVFRRDGLPRGQRDVTLALWRVVDPGNVGTLLRAADAFGAGVAFSEGCADPTGPKALRASAGAVFRVPTCAFDEAGGLRVALVPRGGSSIRDLPADRPLILLLGAEREGLPDDLVTQSHKVTIDQPGAAESLNVAMAGAIALYEASQPLRSRPSA